MGIYFGGNEYDEIHIAGNEFSKLQAGASIYHELDQLGTLTADVTRSGGATVFAFSVSDPNGIRSISAATLTARDNTVANILSRFK